MFHVTRHPIDSHEAREAFSWLDQRSLFNWYPLHLHLARVYAPYLVTDVEVRVGWWGTELLWVIPVAVDALLPEYLTSYNYLASIINVPALNTSYPIAGRYYDHEGWPDWPMGMPNVYVDADISPSPITGPGQFQMPTAALRIPEHVQTVYAAYSKTTRKSMMRDRRCLDDLDVHRISIDRMAEMVPTIAALWQSRWEAENAERVEAGEEPHRPNAIPYQTQAEWMIETFRVMDRHMHTDVQIMGAHEDGRLVALNAVVLRQHDFGNQIVRYADDYAVWKVEGERRPFGKAFFHWNCEYLAPGTIYSLASPYTSGQMIPHQDYKLALVPESLRLTNPCTARLPNAQVAESFDLMPPFYTPDGLMEPTNDQDD